MSAPWSIYALSDPRNGVARYIGFTSQKPQKRLREHIYMSGKSGKTRLDIPVYRWIRKLAESGVKPVISVIETGTGEWQHAERKHIREFRERRNALLNVAEGGIGGKLPPESRYRAGLKLRNRYFSPEHRRRISEGKRGKPRPDAASIARWMAEQNRGRKMILSLEERERRASSVRALHAKGHWTTKVSLEKLESSREKTRQKIKEIWAARSPEERSRITAAVQRNRYRPTAAEQRAKKNAAQRIRRATARSQEVGACQILMQI